MFSKTTQNYLVNKDGCLCLSTPKTPSRITYKSYEVVLDGHFLAKSHVEASMTPVLVFQNAPGQPSRTSKSCRKASGQPSRASKSTRNALEKVLKCFNKQYETINDRPHWSGLYSMSLNDYNASQDKGKTCLPEITNQYLKAFHPIKCIQVGALITHATRIDSMAS